MCLSYSSLHNWHCTFSKKRLIIYVILYIYVWCTKGKTVNLYKNINIASDFLIKEGLSIWDRIHQEYPDIRHGNPNAASIGQAELLYCLNKILIYIEFLCDLNIK